MPTIGIGNMENNLIGKVDTAHAASPQATGNSQQSDGKFRIDAVDEAKFTLGKICAIRHNYHQHRLMQMDSLESLAQRLAVTNQCRFIARETKPSTPFKHESNSPDGRSIDEVFRRIEEPGSWVALYNVQTDPAYQKFVWDVMASADHVFRNEEKVFDVRGFIFISAPPSVTPFHIDREHNFWLQIHGRKTLNVWDRSDTSVVATPDVENFIEYGNLEKVRLKDEMMARSLEFKCKSGDGVFFPSTTPHMTRSDPSWTTDGDRVTVSIGIVFYTDVTRRDAYVHTINRIMRSRLGAAPQPPHQSVSTDWIKYPFGRLVVGARRLFRGYTPPPGF